MLGHMLVEYFKGKINFEVFGLNQEQFSSPKYNYEEKLNKIMPDIIINALRIVVKESENHPEKAMYINSYIPKFIERKYYNSKMKIIHLSTDCVFSGDKGNYSEEDIPDGSGVYSISKSLGEIINNKDLTIRTSYIGPCLINQQEELFDWFIRQNDCVDGFKNAYWNGLTTLELSKQIHTVINNNISGLYHLSSKTKISKYELLIMIKKQWGKNNIKINPLFDNKIDRSLVDNRKELNVSQYNKMFKELHGFMGNNKKLYDHYYQ